MNLYKETGVEIKGLELEWLMVLIGSECSFSITISMLANHINA